MIAAATAARMIRNIHQGMPIKGTRESRKGTLFWTVIVRLSDWITLADGVTVTVYCPSAAEPGTRRVPTKSPSLAVNVVFDATTVEPDRSVIARFTPPIPT